jgi:simple sugar transport system permease protein
VIGVLLVAFDFDPALVIQRFIETFDNDTRRSNLVMLVVPILLCGSGLLLTFTAGLWNIGVEGQITMGAIFATFIAKGITQSEYTVIGVGGAVAFAALGGMLWAMLVAWLKTVFKVNEIFSGVALNFIATNILIYLVSDPWKAPGTSPTTVPFGRGALFPSLPEGSLKPIFNGSQLSPGAIALCAVFYLFVAFILYRSHFGLQLRAMGKNERSAYLLGVRTERNIALALMVCGALAGIAGAVLVLFTRQRLVPGISGGIGFLAVLIVLLIGARAAWLPLVTVLFATVPIGSQRLNIMLGVNAALGGVLQSGLVFAVLLAAGIQTAWFARKRRPHPDPSSHE